MKKFIVFFLLLFTYTGVFASEIMTSARQSTFGKISAVGYYARSEQKVDFGTRGNYDLITDAAMLKLSANVFDNLDLFVKAGRIGALFEKGGDIYEKDENFSDNVFGAGLKYNLFPDTMVTPGISIGFSTVMYNADLNSFSDAVSKDVLIDQQVESLELQGVAYISKNFFTFEPYVGLKVMHNDIKWVDNSPSALDKKIEGGNTGVSPFLGVRFNFLPMVGITMEASALSERSFSAGLTIGF